MTKSDKKASNRFRFRTATVQVYGHTLKDIWDIPTETDVVSSRSGKAERSKEKTHEYGTNFLYRVQSSPYLRAHLASSRELRCSSIVAWKTG